MTNYDFDAWLISVRHYLCTRAKMQMVASDRARRENVPGYILFIERINSMQLDMTKGKPLPVILQFTIPLVIGNIFQQLYNMADTIIVGRCVGAGALAAVGSTGTIMFLATGFAQGITAGFSILTAQRYGAGDEKGVKRSVANGMILAAIGDRKYLSATL